MPIQSEINFKLVSRVIGNLLLVESGALFFVLLVTFLYSESENSEDSNDVENADTEN